MSLHYLNNEVHASITGDADLLLQISGRIIASGLEGDLTGSYKFHMAHDHVWREYNQKCVDFGLTGYMIAPYDAGYRPNPGSLPSAISDTGGYLLAIDDSYLITIAGDRMIRI
jgi:hypothetical protein